MKRNSITIEISTIDEMIQYLNKTIEVCESVRLQEIKNTPKDKLLSLPDNPMMKASAHSQISMEKLVKFLEDLKK